MSTFTDVRTARKRHRCDICHKAVEPGQQYERFSATPGHDVFSDEGWTHMKAHAPYGACILPPPASECGAMSPHGDVCVRLAEHPGLCDSGVGRLHVSSPGKAGKPWRWYRDATSSAQVEIPEAART